MPPSLDFLFRVPNNDASVLLESHEVVTAAVVVQKDVVRTSPEISIKSCPKLAGTRRSVLTCARQFSITLFIEESFSKRFVALSCGCIL